MADNFSKEFSKSVVLTRFGGYENIEVLALPKHDKPKDDEVEVSAMYYGVNFADIYLRKGLIPDMKIPCVLGLECVGVVKNTGNNVKSVKVGDRVLCYRGSGGLYSEVVVVSEKNCFPIPDAVTDEMAVCLPANYLTAYFCLFRVGNLLPGQRILVHSCAGGVGWASVQLARTVKNVTVIGTCSITKREDALSNGVDSVVDTKNYYEELKSSGLANGGFDIIVDSLGGSNIAISQSLLKPLGKVIVTGVSSFIQGDSKISMLELLNLWWCTKHVKVIDLIMNNSCVAGLNLDQLLHSDHEAVYSAMTEIFCMLIEGKIKPRIDSIWNFEQAVDAMKVLSTRKNIGKVVIKL